MTAFATARRHKLEMSQMPANSANQGLARAATDPRLRSTATDKLNSGMQNLASMQTTVRQKVALPRLPGSAPHSRSASPAVPSPCSTRPSTPVGSTSTTPLTPAVTEREKLKLDRLAAEKEWANYMAAGVVIPSGKHGASGLNLVHFWDVSCSF